MTAAAKTWPTQALMVIAQPLAKLYPAEADWRRVVTESGLDPTMLRLGNDEALIVWLRILIGAANPPGPGVVIDFALHEFPDDDELRKAVASPAGPLDAVATRETAQPEQTAPKPPGLESAQPLPPPKPERPLVDRNTLVSLLGEEIDRAAGGQGRAMILVGDSGVGKSRLAEQSGSLARERGMVVLQAQCVGQAAEALLPLRDSLASFPGSRSVEQILSEPPAAFADSIPFLRAFLGQEGGGGGGSSLGGSVEGGVYEGLARVLLGLAGTSGLLLVVEDLTDADQDTLHFLDFFRRKAAPSRSLAISTVKQDLVGDSLRDLLNKWEADGWEVSEVPPLEPQDAAALIAQTWTGEPLAQDRVDRIVAITHGNPFFIEQTLSLVADAADPDTALEDVPKRVEAVLRRRLDRLDDATRSFLEAAAVALEAASQVALIGHVAEMNERTCQAGLRRARDLGFLTEDALGAVTFVQELLRRVVYDQIDARSRRSMHGRAAEWLERAGMLASAAHHFSEAGRNEDLVRTALRGAQQAERGGAYRSALELYRLTESAAGFERVGASMVRASIVVGEWPEAEALLRKLPADAPEVRSLRSSLAFMHGNFTEALEEMELALESDTADRVETLLQLGGITLYLGRLATAADYGRKALAEAADPIARSRCKGLLGACAFFGGDIDGGERSFLAELNDLSDLPAAERDRTQYAVILGNLGQANEVRGQWEQAKRLDEEALGLRREVSDARGELQSIHAVARCHIGLGSIAEGVRLLDEARGLASRLGDRLEEGKIQHTAAQLELLQGRPEAAVDMAEWALQRFRDSEVAYDIAHARFTLATALAAAGDHRRAVEEGARGRAEAERQGFGLLAILFPELGLPYADRIEAGLLAYALGDAVGLPWEGSAPDRIDADRIPTLPAMDTLPSGATSDDTALTLLVAEHLVAVNAAEAPDAVGFLRTLADRAPGLEGLGPSTTAAIDHFRKTGSPPTEGGTSNGAVMRSLPVGWAMPLGRWQDRRAWTIELSRATHPHPDACLAACVGSACAAWAIEGASPQILLDVARDEAAAAAKDCGADDRLPTMLAGLAGGTWNPSPEGVAMDPSETIAAVLWCATTAPTLPEALLAAVRLGGDTDTVAALVGGLLGCGRSPEQVRAQVPWTGRVRLPTQVTLRHVAEGIAGIRFGHGRG